MPLPGFQDFLMPLLKWFAAGGEAPLREAREAMKTELNISDEEASVLLPSGRITAFVNRISWAAIYLHRAGALDRRGRGVYSITSRGRDILADPPDRLDVAYLKRFPELLDFISSKPSAAPNEASAEKLEGDDVEETPEEEFERAVARLSVALEQELITLIKSASPSFFEVFVLDVLVAMGYGGSRREAALALGKSGDEGVDGVIKLDRLGLDVVYVQAKRWEGSVSRPTVQAFVGALAGKQAKRGILITTSSFTKEAQEYVRHLEHRIILLDGSTLVRLAIEHGVGVVPVTSYTVKRADSGYFEEI